MAPLLASQESQAHSGVACSQPISEKRARELCTRLEQGEVLEFPRIPFTLQPEDLEFLLSVRQSTAAVHKNVSYRPRSGKLGGFKGDESQAERLRAVLGRFSKAAAEWAATLLECYGDGWDLDYSSFRPIEEEGRVIRQRARNDLLHVDNFPTRPTYGARILRVFVNANPAAVRRWEVGPPFHELAARPAESAALRRLLREVLGVRSRVVRAGWRAGCAVGLPFTKRPPYDEIMLRFHHHLKADAAFQDQGAVQTLEFPPGSCWVAYTDAVPHAVKSGQFALEKTFLVKPEAMLRPELCPLRILESLAGRALV